jgi:hypothetical protein
MYLLIDNGNGYEVTELYDNLAELLEDIQDFGSHRLNRLEIFDLVKFDRSIPEAIQEFRVARADKRQRALDKLTDEEKRILEIE